MIASVLTDTYISLGLKTSVDNSKDNDNKNFSQKDTRMTLGVCPRDPAYVLWVTGGDYFARGESFHEFIV